MRLQFDESASEELTALLGIGGGERRGMPFIGVRALMLAMLEDAVRAYLGPDPWGHEDAAYWIEHRGRTIFSFATVCETLGLEPGAVRTALGRMRQHAVWAKVRRRTRSRPNARRAGRSRPASTVERVVGVPAPGGRTD